METLRTAIYLENEQVRNKIDRHLEEKFDSFSASIAKYFVSLRAIKEVACLCVLDVINNKAKDCNPSELENLVDNIPDEEFPFQTTVLEETLKYQTKLIKETAALYGITENQLKAIENYVANLDPDKLE